MPDQCMAFPENLDYCHYSCAIFSLKFTKNRLAAGLHPYPMGELYIGASPDP